jgi:hypothetical protein
VDTKKEAADAERSADHYQDEHDKLVLEDVEYARLSSLSLIYRG